jgi:hypothetical protein
LTTVALDKLDKIGEDGVRNDRKGIGGSDKGPASFNLEPLQRKLKTRTAFSLFRRDERLKNCVHL